MEPKSFSQSIAAFCATSVGYKMSIDAGGGAGEGKGRNLATDLAPPNPMPMLHLMQSNLISAQMFGTRTYATPNIRNDVISAPKNTPRLYCVRGSAAL
jgi:hypothetical protein